MKAFTRALTAAIPAAILAIGVVAHAEDAPAAPPAKSSTPFLDKLVNAKALEAGDVEPVRKLKEDLKACHADVKAGKAEKGSCLSKIIDMQKGRLAALAKAVEKIEAKKLKAAVKRAVKWTTRMVAKWEKILAKKQAKAASGEAKPAGDAKPADAPAPAPAPAK
jgi:hypothetical protein